MKDDVSKVCTGPMGCEAHEKIAERVNMHAGYWKIALISASTITALLISFCTWQAQQTNTMREMVGGLSETVAALVAVSVEHRKNTDHNIDRIERRLQILDSDKAKDD